MGIKGFEGQRQLKWETGFIAGLNVKQQNHTLRFALEMASFNSLNNRNFQV